MEVTFAWFWAVQLIAFMSLFAIIYVAFKKEFKSFTWNIMGIAAAIIMIINPIKINGTNSTQYTSQQSSNIANTKQLPPKTMADNWKKINVEGITKEDLK